MGQWDEDSSEGENFESTVPFEAMVKFDSDYPVSVLWEDPKLPSPDSTWLQPLRTAGNGAILPYSVPAGIISHCRGNKVSV